MTLIKWPGGKKREIKEFSDFIPKFDRYIEPFFGGGAVFFHLQPEKAAINDISTNLMDFYRLVQQQDEEFHKILELYADSFNSIKQLAEKNLDILHKKFNENSEFKVTEIAELFDDTVITKLVWNVEDFFQIVTKSINDKIRRTIKNNVKSPMIAEDLDSNLITGFTSGFYLYFRDIYNDMQLERAKHDYSLAYKIANFYWIREYCYGSMFRYNKNGEFNIPYGGISYNKKNFQNKINDIFSYETQDLFTNVNISNLNFETFVDGLKLTESDFIFLDPPYDTEFSDYEGRTFDHHDQIRLRNFLTKTNAKIMLVIKNTDFIFNLYNNDHFHIINFDKQYTYNVRDRNERNVDHLIITNYRLTNF